MVTYEELFAKIEAHINKADKTKERKVPYSYTFKLTKDGNVIKSYFIDLKNLTYKVGEHPADCTITLDHELMVKLGTGAMKAADALSQDLVSIEGKVELVMALETFIGQLNA
uniref:CSON004099 protein n=1 Tax=Culicoides sonorensis TaxID=179676 RepID=A0A336N0W2_CULSO